MADLVDHGKAAAAKAAVNDYVKSWTSTGAGRAMRIGIGSGSTVVYAVAALKEVVEGDANLEVVCVPTSFQARQLIIDAGLPLSDLNQTPTLDVAIDGADEVDAKLQLIKGGGGCMLQEKCVAAAATTMVVIADYRKDSQQLGEKWRKGIPVEVVPFAYRSVMATMAQRIKGSTQNLRQAKSKAGPCVTDNGNFVVDLVTDKVSVDEVAPLDVQLLTIPGVVETGLFTHSNINIQRVYFGQATGDVKIIDKA